VRLLFVHQNFPGQYLHILRHLAAAGRHEIVFITEPNENRLVGIRKVPYRPPAPATPGAMHESARDFDTAMRRAEAVAATARSLRQLGFTPDAIIGHHGWGELLNLPDVWPDAPILGYLEFFYRVRGADVNFDPEFPMRPEEFARVRAKNAVNLLALGLEREGQSPTEWQRSTYPDWAQPRITLLREGADLDLCRPDPAARRTALEVGGMRVTPEDKLVTYVARDLEPYRGFHVVMRALPRLLRARGDIKVVLVGGDGVSYGAPPPRGTWRQQMLEEVGAALDMTRVVLPGRIEYDAYRRMLQRSDAHLYLTYPFVASWSLREALAMGCAVVGSDTTPVREFIAPEETGLLVPFHDPAALGDAVLRVLDDPALARRLREGARRFASDRLDLRDTIAGYVALIGRMTGVAPEEVANGSALAASLKRC
jgi:glycosyltransferase involved in cell wall biosynthesis